jgi:hypothetical protein
VIACVSWWQEPPGFLAELVASLGRAGVDHLVAVDGSYGGRFGGEAAGWVAAGDDGADPEVFPCA